MMVVFLIVKYLLNQVYVNISMEINNSMPMEYLLMMVRLYVHLMMSMVIQLKEETTYCSKKRECKLKIRLEDNIIGFQYLVSSIWFPVSGFQYLVGNRKKYWNRSPFVMDLAIHAIAKL